VLDLAVDAGKEAVVVVVGVAAVVVEVVVDAVEFAAAAVAAVVVAVVEVAAVVVEVDAAVVDIATAETGPFVVAQSEWEIERGVVTRFAVVVETGTDHRHEVEGRQSWKELVHASERKMQYLQVVLAAMQEEMEASEAPKMIVLHQVELVWRTPGDELGLPCCQLLQTPLAHWCLHLVFFLEQTGAYTLAARGGAHPLNASSYFRTLLTPPQKPSVERPLHFQNVDQRFRNEIS